MYLVQVEPNSGYRRKDQKCIPSMNKFIFYLRSYHLLVPNKPAEW